MADREREEKRRHSTAYMPYSCYECRIPYDFVNVPMHWHGEFEINYILRGQGEFICGNERFHAKKGDVLVILPNMLHAAYPDADSDLIYRALVFHPSMLGAGLSDRCAAMSIHPLISGKIKIAAMISGEAENGEEIRKIVEQIFSCAAGDVPHADLLMKSGLMQLIWLLLTDKNSISREDAGAGSCEAIRPALEFMAKNFRRTITVSELADISHLSKSYFMNCFKKSAGASAMEYLTQLRVNAACGALSSTEKRISEIAFDCGYENLSNFNRQFKKLTGYSPNEYRKRSPRLVDPLDLFVCGCDR